ncbi:MAG TPA: histidine phosphatase family protein [Cyanobacteria bacterium UBA11149]|nr:histidine phosphatase family protein [Cyanobacteria bacterium UBA11367]HBE59608.1 histidine phosphatase family protein [Cyanobacteria bacterium UBA11366]HBK65138.1 histidine phosphatase family protein [Cyanobacteria bacterium UBA11166]HBR75447.1 histidine phosphatase family protein [Cyanobacteria bacterium UBA11159]HBS70011.1 histidine phosphatase family protein [Cyanobacteria bacterium UBA11153]HBW91988.1 histidine phosphatase family protein [Cyanobacteria bacterium UBA11149]HCA94120.1 hi
MKLYSIRHLKTPWNLEGKLQGRKNIDILPPNVETLDNIQKNQTILGQLPSFDLVLVSRLKRTQQTAELYKFNNFLIESLIDELDFGTLEGEPNSILKSPLYQQWSQNPRYLKLGESLINLENRILAFLTKYQEFKNILIFSHGAWMRGLLSIIEYGNVNGMNTTPFYLKHNELLKIEIQNSNNGEFIGNWKRLK